MEFKEFPKIPRLFRDCVITEKIDGTNASIFIPELPGEIEGPFLVGSRTRWITPQDDNFGFARWCHEHTEEVLKLGPGHHFGEWWGQGIQRGYGLKEKRFSLFNTHRWGNDATRPPLFHVVPVLYEGPFFTETVHVTLADLETSGSVASPGFNKPEGVVVFHKAGGYLFKATIEKDDEPKSKK